MSLEISPESPDALHYLSPEARSAAERVLNPASFGSEASLLPAGSLASFGVVPSMTPRNTSSLTRADRNELALDAERVIHHDLSHHFELRRNRDTVEVLMETNDEMAKIIEQLRRDKNLLENRGKVLQRELSAYQLGTHNAKDCIDEGIAYAASIAEEFVADRANVLKGALTFLYGVRNDATMSMQRIRESENALKESLTASREVLDGITDDSEDASAGLRALQGAMSRFRSSGRTLGDVAEELERAARQSFDALFQLERSRRDRLEWDARLERKIVLQQQRIDRLSLQNVELRSDIRAAQRRAPEVATAVKRYVMRLINGDPTTTAESPADHLPPETTDSELDTELNDQIRTHITQLLDDKRESAATVTALEEQLSTRSSRIELLESDLDALAGEQKQLMEQLSAVKQQLAKQTATVQRQTNDHLEEIKRMTTESAAKSDHVMSQAAARQSLTWDAFTASHTAMLTAAAERENFLRTRILVELHQEATREARANKRLSQQLFDEQEGRRDESQKLQEAVASLREQLRAAEHSRDDLHSASDKLRHQHKLTVQSHEQQSEEASAQIAELKRRLVKSNSELADKTDENDQLSREATKLHSKVADLQRELEQFDEHNDNLRGELRDAKAKQADAEHELGNERQQSKRRMELLEQHGSEQQKSGAEVAKRVETLERDVRELAEDKKKASARIFELQAQLEQAVNDNEHLQTQLRNQQPRTEFTRHVRSDRAHPGIEAELRDLREKLAATQQQLQQQQQEGTEKATPRSQQTSHIVADQKVTVPTPRETDDDNHRKHEILKHRAEEAEREVDELREKCREATRDATKAGLELASAQEELVARADALKKAQDHNRELTNRLQELSEDASSPTRRRALDSVETYGSQLQDQLAVAQREQFASREEVVRLQHHAKELESEVAELRDATGEARRKAEECEELRSKLRATETRAAAAEERAAEASEEQRKQRQILKHRAEEAEREVDELREKCREATRDATKAGLDLASTQEELAATKCDLARATQKAADLFRSVEELGTKVDETRDDAKTSVSRQREAEGLRKVNEDLQHRVAELESEGHQRADDLDRVTRHNKLLEEEMVEFREHASRGRRINEECEDLRSKLRAAEARIEAQSKRESTTEAEHLQATENLESRLKVAVDEVNDLRDRTLQSVRELTEAKMQIVTLEDAIAVKEGLLNDADQLEKSNRALKSEIRNHQATIDDLQQTVDGQARKLAAKAADFDELLQQNARLNDIKYAELEASREDIVKVDRRRTVEFIALQLDCTQDLELLQRRVLHSEWQDRWKSGHSDLVSEVSAASIHEAVTLRKQLNACLAREEEMSQESARHQQETIAAKSNVNALENDLRALQQEAKEKVATITRIDQLNDELERRTISLGEQLEEQRAILHTRELELNDGMVRLRASAGEVSELTAVVEGRGKQIEERDASIAALRETLRGVEDAAATQRREVERLSTDLARVEKDNTGLQQLITKTKEVASGLESQLRQAHATSDELEVKLATEERHHLESTRTVEKQAATITSLEQDCAKSTEACRTLESRVQSLENNLDAAQSMISGQVETIASQTAELEELTTQYRILSNSHKEICASYEDAINANHLLQYDVATTAEEADRQDIYREMDFHFQSLMQRDMNDCRAFVRRKEVLLREAQHRCQLLLEHNARPVPTEVIDFFHRIHVDETDKRQRMKIKYDNLMKKYNDAKVRLADKEKLSATLMTKVDELRRKETKLGTELDEVTRKLAAISKEASYSIKARKELEAKAVAANTQHRSEASRNEVLEKELKETKAAAQSAKAMAHDLRHRSHDYDQLVATLAEREVELESRTAEFSQVLDELHAQLVEYRSKEQLLSLFDDPEDDSGEVVMGWLSREVPAANPDGRVADPDHVVRERMNLVAWLLRTRGGLILDIWQLFRDCSAVKRVVKKHEAKLSSVPDQHSHVSIPVSRAEHMLGDIERAVMNAVAHGKRVVSLYMTDIEKDHVGAGHEFDAALYGQLEEVQLMSPIDGGQQRESTPRTPSISGGGSTTRNVGTRSASPPIRAVLWRTGASPSPSVKQ